MTFKVDPILAALADPTRRHVVELLRHGPKPAGELARRTHSSAPAISRHLRVLRESGLVEARVDEADARLRLYRLRRRPFRDLQAWLDQVDAFWGEQLASFERHTRR